VSFAVAGELILHEPIRAAPSPRDRTASNFVATPRSFGVQWNSTIISPRCLRPLSYL
jgi:hypothetical protein